MRKLSGKRYWLIGASEGLGRAVAFELAKAGAKVIVSARNAERLEELAGEIGKSAEAVPVDIADRASVVAAADAVGEMDGVVFLAGVYWPMKATEWDAESAETMADVNFTGAFRCMGAVVPGMVERGAGHIVITGSLSGFRGLPGAIGYAASKAGVMALAESMKADLQKTGVDVQLINPGFIKTRLTDKNDFKMPFIMEPEEAAEIFVVHMRGERFAKSFPRLFSLVFRGSRFLPYWLYFRVFGA